MIDLRDGKITDLINNQMAYNPETISIGYAILQEKQRLIALAERTRLMAVVENLDEWVLDYLAVELRAPAYEDSFPIEVKRELIAGTLPFYAKLGTPKAINWATQTIFGGSQMQEWFEYGGEPYHFKIRVNVSGEEVTPEKDRKMRHVIFACKNLRSHLDEIGYFVKPSRAQAPAGACFLGVHGRVGAAAGPSHAGWPQVAIGLGAGGAYLGHRLRLGGSIMGAELRWPEGSAGTGVGAALLGSYQKIDTHQKASEENGTLE